MLSRRSFLARVTPLVTVGAAALPPLAAAAQEPKAVAKPLAVPVNPSAAFLEAIDAKFREPVRSVLRAPTLTAKHAEEPFFAQPSVYDWFLDHPDRTALAWRRLNIPCAEVLDQGGGAFGYKDEAGNEVSWRAVAKHADGVVWYATGKVKPAALLPVVPVKAVAIVKCPRKASGATGEMASFEPSGTVYVQTDSKAATAILRVVGPAAPRMAEQGAEQLLLFFSGPARYVFEHPEDAAKLMAPAARR